MHTRLTNVLKERTEFLKSSVDKYLIVESKTLKELKENLELELGNIKVNCMQRELQSNADLHKCNKNPSFGHKIYDSSHESSSSVFSRH